MTSRAGQFLDRPWFDRLRRRLTLRKEVFSPSARILDIGCGDRKRGSLGVDIAPTPGADVVADGLQLPFRDDAFDSVICYHLIEHLSVNHIARLLREINRVLHPGGRVHLLVDRDVDRCALLSKDSTHVDRYRVRTIRYAVSECFVIEVFQTHNALGNLHRHPLTWWRYLGKGTKVYVEGAPRKPMDRGEGSQARGVDV